MLRQFGTFTGGIDLPDDKDATIACALAPAPPLPRLHVPLALAGAPPLGGKPAAAVVAVGQRVARGKRLAAARTPDQVDVFAPLAGRVAGFATAMLATWPSGWRETPAVILDELDAPAPLAGLDVVFDWLAADAHSIRLRIAEGGLTTLRPPVRPLAAWPDAARAAGADVLLCNALENAPYVTADHRLLAERGREVVTGLAILARALEVRETMLAVDHRRTDSYRAAVEPARLYHIQSIALDHKYPIGADAIMTRVLTRRQVPLGGQPLDVRVAIVDAATCWAVYRWVACGERLLARVVTISGPKVGRPGNFLVPLGARVEDLMRACQAGLEDPPVHGQPMNGQQCPREAVVGSDTNAVLALGPAEMHPPTPCIRCGWCGDNCPARLNVAGLNDDFELARLERARRRGALACVHCGICSYVCPARLPLSWRLLLLKQAIRAEQAHSS